MKRFVSISMILMIIAAPLLFSGCGTKGYNQSEYAASVDKANATIRSTGLKFFEGKQKRDAAILDKLENNETAAVLYGLMAADQDKAALIHLRPQKIEKPKSGMDVLDTVASRTLPTFFRMGFGYLFGKEVVGALAGASASTSTIEVGGKDNVLKIQSENVDSFKELSAGNDLIYTGPKGEDEISTSEETEAVIEETDTPEISTTD